MYLIIHGISQYKKVKPHLKVSKNILINKILASRSLHTQPTACVAAPHTLPVNYAELQNQRVGCVRYARTRLLN